MNALEEQILAREIEEAERLWVSEVMAEMEDEMALEIHFQDCISGMDIEAAEEVGELVAV
jgi:hypothetical protein